MVTPKPIHPRRAAIHERRTLGERLADAISAGMGSWRFIIVWLDVCAQVLTYFDVAIRLTSMPAHQ